MFLLAQVALMGDCSVPHMQRDRVHTPDAAFTTLYSRPQLFAHLSS